jgi:methanogenic corrinoid protein MtbC1
MNGSGLVHNLRKPIVMDLANNFMEAILSLDRVSAKQFLDDHHRGTTPIKFVEDVIVVALERIGVLWQEGSIALSQVYMGGRICEELVDEILPAEAPERKNQPKMAICSLTDYHKLGRVIVYSLLRASGFELSDYGTIGIDDLIERIEKDKIRIILVSVLMLPSALHIKKLREKLTHMDLDVKIVVGGAPFRFDDQLWRQVGADAMGDTASDAVSLVHHAMGGVS